MDYSNTISEDYYPELGVYELNQVTFLDFPSYRRDCMNERSWS